MIADDVGSSPAQSIYFHVIPIEIAGGYGVATL